MRNFDQWALQEGWADVAPTVSSAKTLFKDISAVIPRGLEAVWEMLRNKYPKVWDGILKLYKDPARAAQLQKKAEEAKPQEEGTLTAGGAEGIQQVGYWMDMIMSGLGWGLAGIALIFIMWKWGGDILRLVAHAGRYAKEAVSSGPKPEEEEHAMARHIRKQKHADVVAKAKLAHNS